MANWHKVVDVVVSTLGIYICFLCQGVCQESIYRLKLNTHGPYGTTNDLKFKYPIFLVSLVCSLSALFGFTICKFLESTPSKVLPALYEFFARRPFQPLASQESQLREKTGFGETLSSDELLVQQMQNRKELLKQGLYVSLSYIGSMIATNYALTRVYYPMQIIVKSAKAIPVIVGGYVFFGKTYHYSDYLTVFCVTMSLIIFQAGSLINSKSDTTSTWLGFGALVLALFFDGLTGPRQDKMVETYGISVGDLMLVINVCAIPVGWTASALLEGGAPFIVLLNNTAKLLPRVVLFILCGATGQVFIVRILRTLGALHLTLITTTRKFLAILISVALYRHPLSQVQWFSVVLLFSSGFFKYILKEKKPITQSPSAIELKKTSSQVS